MIRIRIVKGDSKVETFYKTFAETVSMKENVIVLFDYVLLQELFHIAEYNEIDFDNSFIQYSDGEKYAHTKIYLKSGMKLDLERVRVNNEIYVLTSMKFSWEDSNYEYKLPEKINDIEDVYLVIS